VETLQATSAIAMMQATTEKADEAATTTTATAQTAAAAEAQSEKPQSLKELVMLEVLKCIGVAAAALIFTAIMKAVKSEQSPEL
jgi:hypothetical protein